MFNYGLNFIKWIDELLHPDDRHQFQIRFMYVLLKPMRDLHNQFLTFVEARRLDARWTGATISMQDMLNYKFQAGTGIYIQNHERPTGQVFMADIGSPLNAKAFDTKSGQNAYMFDTNSAVNTISFTVFVPDYLVFNVVKMRAEIDRKKPYGTNYIISTYSAQQAPGL